MVRGTLTAQTIIAQTITSSTDFVTGSTRFGSSLANTHQFTGSVSITGSLTLPYLSTGSVLFAGATDNIAEDNSNLFWDNINKRLGIGTNAPTTLLHISGSTGGLLEIDSNTASNILYVSSSGIIGINTTSLAYGSAGSSAGKLTINNTSGNNGLAIRNGDGGYQLNIKTTTNDSIGTEFVWFDGATTTFLQYGGSIGARLGLSTIAQFRTNNADSSATIHTGGSTTERLRITSTGNVGIGTTSPAEKVSIVGNLKVITTAAADNAGTASIILNPEVNTPATIQALSNFGPTSATVYSTGFKFITSNRDASLPNPYYSIDAMSILANGNVGIGTTSPSAKLEVNGNTIISGSLTVITGSSVELRVTNIGVTIGNAITDVHTVTGSLSISGSVTATNFTGSLFGTASWAANATTASYVLNAVSASFATRAISASYADDFTVRNFLNIDSASLDYQQNLTVATGSFQTIVSVATGSYKCAFFDYVTYSGSTVRAGTLVSTWSGSVTEYYENYTADLGGSTSVVTLQTAISGSNIQLQAGISGSAWAVRSLVRLL